MEQDRNSEQLAHRLSCGDESLISTRTHYCNNRNQDLCNCCPADFDEKCISNETPYLKDIADRLKMAKLLLSSIKQDSQQFKDHSSLKAFEEDLKNLSTEFAKTIENAKSHELNSVISEILQQTCENRLEEQNQTTADTIEESTRRKELKILEHERKIQEVVFNRIYGGITGKEIPDLPNFYLKINLRDRKQKLLLKNLVVSKLRLPDLNGIQINFISDGDKNLASFLCNCTPVQLRLLRINWYTNSNTGIKSKFYSNSFLKAAARTTKEVAFNCIDFRAKDLQTVFRAAKNTQCIIFHFCCIHCSPALDFGKDLKFNIKFLSFQFSGSTGHEEITTDWKRDPLCFSSIVNAIGNSGLRASLQKVCIFTNETLSKSKLQMEFNAKGMSHISVVEDFVVPLSS